MKSGTKQKIILQCLLAGITLLLLSSVGGAGAIAAPILLPLHFLAARSTTKTSVKVLWAVLGAATAAEAIWVLTYLAIDMSEPLIWLLPGVAGVIAGAIILWGPREPFARRGAAG